MGDVFLDNEPVVFDGPPPGDAGQIRRLLEQALAQEGRSLVSFIVDGREADEAESLPSHYKRIEARSARFEEILARLCRDQLAAVEGLPGALDAWASRCLSVRWADGRAGVIEQIERLDGLVRLLEPLEHFGRNRGRSWHQGLVAAGNALTESLPPLIDAIQASAVVSVSDLLARRLAPQTESLATLLGQSVLPDLTSEGPRA